MSQSVAQAQTNATRSAGTTCYASTCTFVGFDRRSKEVVSWLGDPGVTRNVAANARMKDLHLLGAYVAVAQLSIRQPIEPFDPAELLMARSLTLLRIELTHLSDLRPLVGLPLKELRLIEIPNDFDHSPVGTSSELTDLGVQGSRFSDPSRLTRLANLSMLDLSDTPISNLAGIDALHDLRSFSCHRCKSLVLLSPLIGHPTLEHSR